MNFDRVAQIYDETRGLPDRVVERVSRQIVEASGAMRDTRFLEIGIGTGRIALPLIEAGYDFTGVDISEKMTSRLRAKAGDRPNLHLELADVTKLPFADNTFDVAIAVHVLHLLPSWHEALDEAGRVLSPGGYFVLGDDRHQPDSAMSRLRNEWARNVRSLGGQLRPRHGGWDEFIAELGERGWQPVVYRVARFERRSSALDYIEAMSSRTFSDSWSVEEDILAATRKHLMDWASRQFGDVSVGLPDRSDFLLAVARLPY